MSANPFVIDGESITLEDVVAVAENPDLTDILEAADAIGRFCAGVTLDLLMGDEMRQAAILQKLIIIGEAVAHLSRRVPSTT